MNYKKLKMNASLGSLVLCRVKDVVWMIHIHV